MRKAASSNSTTTASTSKKTPVVRRKFDDRQFSEKLVHAINGRNSRGRAESASLSHFERRLLDAREGRLEEMVIPPPTTTAGTQPKRRSQSLRQSRAAPAPRDNRESVSTVSKPAVERVVRAKSATRKASADPKTAMSRQALSNGTRSKSQDFTDHNKKLADRIRKLKEENRSLRQKLNPEFDDIKDLERLPRKELLALIVQLESREVRKPVREAIKKITSMADSSLQLQEQLQQAQQMIDTLITENDQLQVKLRSEQSKNDRTTNTTSVSSTSNSRKSPEKRKVSKTQSTSEQPPAAAKEKENNNDKADRPPNIPRLEIPQSSEEEMLSYMHDSRDSDYPEININGYEQDEEDTPEAVGDLIPTKDNDVITDPSKMIRYDYEQIACDILYAARAQIVRRKWILRCQSRDRQLSVNNNSHK